MDLFKYATVVTANIPFTDNDDHDKDLGEFIRRACEAGLLVDSVRQYTLAGYVTTFVQARSQYANEKGEPT